MDSMATLVRRRRLRGLAVHHRRHPSKHAGRLVSQDREVGDDPIRGICPWCGDCGGAADEVDHRLAINVARALGPAGLRRVFTQENLRCCVAGVTSERRASTGCSHAI